ncbi:ABC transporter ATP-binding protein [Vacuolonema iberomarrocanum]|uniref:ABC transporter ATP-binding protein n=1 Tax=Vacuolonema iberomarrocanum TaxID=3454632 RepID=UPI001A0B8E01|nr:ABC transporter ATP-binding protein [filamentous cyanobacterium LEGE 07170]
MKQLNKRKRQNSLIHNIWQLLGYMGHRKRQLSVLIVLMVLSAFSEVVSLGTLLPFLSTLSDPQELLSSAQWQPVLEWLQITSPSQLITTLSIAFITTIAFTSVIRLVTLKARINLSAAIGSDISAQIYQKTLNQPYQFHLCHNSSDLMQTLVDDTNRLMTFILMPILAVFTESVLAISLIGALVLIDAQIALSAAIVLGGSYTLIYRMRQNLLKQNSKIVTLAGQRKIKAVQEGIGSIRDVIVANSHEFFQGAYQEAELSFKRGQAKNAYIAQSPRFILDGITMGGIALLALMLGRNGDFSQAVPILGSLALGAKRLLPSLQGVFTGLAQIQGASSSLDRILIALSRPVDPLLLLPKTKGFLPLRKELRLENIWFRYSEADEWTLKNLNLSIEAKTTVAFVGSTGSGKSTTADLILGLLKPQLGLVWVDGQPLKGEKLKQWQQGIAHVPQSIFLTDASIAENIAFAVPKDQIDFGQVRKAARLAQIDDYIESLPAGYDTYVGERGVRLSGGQRQRIGIARALYGQASLIVFDEATSALDNSTEKEVMDAINALSHQYTVILIAHRLSTVEKCDKIFELNEGSLIAQGTFERLSEESPSFRVMAQQAKN